MTDIKDDFYKRFTRDGGLATDFFLPAAQPLLGGFSHSGASLSVNLSFGTRAAARKRTDGRVIIADALSDIDYRTNFSSFSMMGFPEWVKSILSAAKEMPDAENGFEMLISDDTESDYFSSRLLLAKKVMKEFFQPNTLDITLLNSTPYPFYHLSSLLPDKKLVAVNSLTFETIAYPLPLKNSKLVLAIIEPQKFDTPDGFSYRERTRLKRFSSADDLFPLIEEARYDLSKHIKGKDILYLSEATEDFTKNYNFLPRLSGIIAFIEKDKIDQFIASAQSRYEKKTGKKPAFFISD